MFIGVQKSPEQRERETDWTWSGVGKWESRREWCGQQDTARDREGTEHIERARGQQEMEREWEDREQQEWKQTEKGWENQVDYKEDKQLGEGKCYDANKDFEICNNYL